jgi:hypothetical protein
VWIIITHCKSTELIAMARTLRLDGLLAILWTFMFVQLSHGDAVDDLAATSLNNVYKVLNGSLSDGATHSSTCTKDNVLVRREWYVTREMIRYKMLIVLDQGKLYDCRKDGVH